MYFIVHTSWWSIHSGIHSYSLASHSEVLNEWTKFTTWSTSCQWKCTNEVHRWTTNYIASGYPKQHQCCRKSKGKKCQRSFWKLVVVPLSRCLICYRNNFPWDWPTPSQFWLHKAIVDLNDFWTNLSTFLETSLTLSKFSFRLWFSWRKLSPKICFHITILPDQFANYQRAYQCQCFRWYSKLKSYRITCAWIYRVSQKKKKPLVRML